MSDVRSLLRQQREARRIDHPHAAYSDAGKLLCTLCREQVKTEALWDNHLQAPNHRQNAQRARSAAAATQSKLDEGTDETPREQKASASEGGVAESSVPSHLKRKHSRDLEGDEIMDDAVRRKRSRPEINDADKDTANRPNRSNSETRTPPSLARRPSTTPSQGVELQIPSRPATPSHKDGSSASTPGTVVSSGLGNGVTVKTTTKGPSSTAATAGAGTGEAANTPSTAQVDESEWAAFEADIAAASAPYDADATISAPAMTAEETAAAQAENSNDDSKRKSKADVDLEDEKEEATRALEEEFEEMEELEARVQRLREKREDIRKKRSESQGQATAVVPVSTKVNGVAGKENAESAVVEEEDEDDDDDDDDEDDWDSFRFRGR